LSSRSRGRLPLLDDECGVAADAAADDDFSLGRLLDLARWREDDDERPLPPPSTS
jgi:hypothetical protein